MSILFNLEARPVASRTPAHSSRIAQGCSSIMTRSATVQPTLVASSRRMRPLTVLQIFPSDMFWAMWLVSGRCHRVKLMLLTMDGPARNFYRTLAPVKPGRKHQKAVAPLRLCS